MLGALLLSGSIAFASFPVNWVFRMSPDSELPNIKLLHESPLPQIRKNRSVEESYFFEYEAWRRIHSSA